MIGQCLPLRLLETFGSWYGTLSAEARHNLRHPPNKGRPLFHGVEHPVARTER